VLRKLKPDFFAEDFKFILYLGGGERVARGEGECGGFSRRQSCETKLLADDFENQSVGRQAMRLAD